MAEGSNRQTPSDTKQARPGPIVAALIGAAFALVLIIALSGGHVDRMTYGEGYFYRYVAAHLDSGPAELDPTFSSRGPALRYGRIGLPVLTWTFAAGRSAAMPYAQPVVMILSAAAVAAASYLLIPRLGVLAGIVPFLGLGLTLTLRGYVEPLALAAGLWAVVFAHRRRWLPAIVLLSTAMLVRETAAFIAIALVAWALLTNERRGARLMLLAFLPVLAWHAFVATRFGSWPATDPYLGASGLSFVPFRSTVAAILDPEWPIRLTALAHCVLGGLAISQWRSSAIGAVAAASSLQLLTVPALTWEFPGDVARTFTLLHVLIVLVGARMLLSRRNGERVLPDARAIASPAR